MAVISAICTVHMTFAFSSPQDSATLRLLEILSETNMETRNEGNQPPKGAITRMFYSFAGFWCVSTSFPAIKFGFPGKKRLEALKTRIF